MLLSLVWRVVLINLVLDGLPMHLMTALQVSAGTFKVIYAKGRVFLSTGKDTGKGGQCLISWVTACRAKEEGNGLGIHRLDVQNSWLLLKLVHRPCTTRGRSPGLTGCENMRILQLSLVKFMVFIGKPCMQYQHIEACQPSLLDPGAAQIFGWTSALKHSHLQRCS